MLNEISSKQLEIKLRTNKLLPIFTRENYHSIQQPRDLSPQENYTDRATAACQ
jgi:hypothetical protein